MPYHFSGLSSRRFTKTLLRLQMHHIQCRQRSPNAIISCRVGIPQPISPRRLRCLDLEHFLKRREFKRPYDGCLSRVWYKPQSPHITSATPDLPLSSYLRNITGPQPVPNYSAWRQRQVCMSGLPRPVSQRRSGRDSNPQPHVILNSPQ